MLMHHEIVSYSNAAASSTMEVFRFHDRKSISVGREWM
ncbi:conserved domain protein [Paenibacillus sp. HGF5]|nr:conserved domain protein [Paenibacillus sp. HGF5]